ncbi:MAG: (NiFe) hydrogenase maturation protein HypF [Candidatus Hecatellales archaeon B24]|nr:MAG: (NiFe) hydrogenase maturation protein HypF [Candidatus Hecatellales archaeon B24]
MRAEVRVLGIVQGVGFRPFIYRLATELKLKGYVRNRGDAGVEIVVEGDEVSVRSFIRRIEADKPPAAQISRLDAKLMEDKGGFKEFKILKSTEERGDTGSIIPPDMSICEHCLKEFFNPSNRRHRYYFITCTDCGPRYTIIERLPYDRPNTTMKDFPLCPQCLKEYTSPEDRRFHAQTVACPACGPKAFLADRKGVEISCGDPFLEAGKLLAEGFILAIKGIGGFHVATSTINPEPVRKLRKAKYREQKPFAIMARSLNAVQTFAQVSSLEEKLLTSPERPIVLLKKSGEYYLAEEISPGLHNVGVMLPYTGLHYLLFEGAKEEPALVMTSGNLPAEPIISDNQEAVEKLAGFVDYFLFHERRIAQPCDDSVVKSVDGKPVFIRRSRGYAPAPIKISGKLKQVAVAYGAEENVTACIAFNGKAFLSQYVGEVEKVEGVAYLERTVKRLLALTCVKPEVLACDLHPRFNSTLLARKQAEEFGCRLVQVQHHYAHALSLMAEHGLEEMVAVVCDGFGYGADGKAWGGEVLHCGLTGWKRLAHLEEQPMIGGDLAALYPLRMAYGMLARAGFEEAEEWLKSKAEMLPHGEQEAEVIVKMFRQGRFTPTTSTGRVLDAAAAILNVCYRRTYEGEPAMKLEAAASRGRKTVNLKPEISGEVLKTSNLACALIENSGRYRVEDLAYTVEEYLAEGLAELACAWAERLGVKAVGFTGGVAFNHHITSAFRRLVEGRGLKLYVNLKVPPGDGGLSLGQAFKAGLEG